MLPHGAHYSVSTEPKQKDDLNRLKREDFTHVKHDKFFTKWKILIGHSDWQDHAHGKEGATKYRVHNLPSTYFGPGVYELGIVKPAALACKKKSRRLTSKDIIVVYLGQADKIRQRLQSYGQAGSHLEGGYFLTETMPVKTGKFSEVFADQGNNIGRGGTALRQGPRLFSEVFARGYSIAFRWATADSKTAAEKVEAQLLNTFDYAWNKGGNGARRSLDILTKLELKKHNSTLCVGGLKSITRVRWIFCGKRRPGIVVVELQKPLEEKGHSKSISFTIKGVISFFNIKHETESSSKEQTGSAEAKVCGLELEDGQICKAVPVKGRKRCTSHRGMRQKTRKREVSNKKKIVSEVLLQEARKTSLIPMSPEASSGLPSSPDITITGAESSVDGRLVCGVISNDGYKCTTPPAKGRKRCPIHKGMKIKTKLWNHEDR